MLGNAEVSVFGDESISFLRDYLESKTLQNAEMQKRVYLGMRVYFQYRKSPKKNILALIEKLASAFPYDDMYREKEHERGNWK